MHSRYQIVPWLPSSEFCTGTHRPALVIFPTAPAAHVFEVLVNVSLTHSRIAGSGWRWPMSKILDGTKTAVGAVLTFVPEAILYDIRKRFK